MVSEIPMCIMRVCGGDSKDQGSNHKLLEQGTD